MSACQRIRQRADNYDITCVQLDAAETEQRTKKFPRGWHSLFSLLPILLSEQESCRSGEYCAAQIRFPIAKGYTARLFDCATHALRRSELSGL
jgi:hypothetical protein